MSTPLKPDPVATDVLAKLRSDREEHLGVVSFSGYLDEQIDCDGNRRIYVDETFRSWLAVKADDIVHQVAGSDPLDCRSVFWVKRHAHVIHCRARYAYAFSEPEVEPEDPTGGYLTARWPPPRP